jgi:hypothetical protein
MLRTPALLTTLVVVLASSGCNCGKPVVTTTMGSIAIGSEVLDFGVVSEGTSKGGKFRVDNNGRAAVNVVVTLASGSSADFALGTVPATIEAGSFIEVPVVFTPVGRGSDEGFAEINEAGGMEDALRVQLKGGPIFPLLDPQPDPVDFRPATMALERKMVQLRSVGTSALTITAVGVSATGNPDFSVTPPTLPTRLLPGESVAVRVEYARSARTTEGVMEVLSDDSDAGLRRVRLLPDPPAACSNLMDDDGDGLSDFPNDPGCQDAMDSDEYNPAQCVNGATQPCGGGDGGFCSGMRSCVNGLWGACMGAGMPTTETCNNIDDDCNGAVDNGVTQACYSGPAGTRGVGNCRDGFQTCTQGVFGTACASEVLPSSEVCGNSIDENCNGQLNDGCAIDAGVRDAGVPDAGVDAGTSSCNPNGVFTLDAGVIQYTCCDFGIAGFPPLVSLDIESFTIQSNATVVRPLLDQPQNTLVNPAPAATCPSGSFSYSRAIAGTCTETYTLTGTFVGPNTFVGTYTATFVGSDCTGSFCAADPCTNQSWNISAGR